MLLKILILIIFIYLFIELNHKFRIDSPLKIKPIKFKEVTYDSKQKYVALIEINNVDKKMEVMIPSLKVTPQLIGISKNALISMSTKIKPHTLKKKKKNKNMTIGLHIF